jgi:regulation of enolase protein 1 (concanavalin A-like superfamily)
MVAINRRSFLEGAVSISCAALLHDSAVQGAAAAETHLASRGELIPHMKWMNDPASWRVANGQIIVRSRPKTDFWRKTFYGYITDNGHFFHLPAGAEFTFEARIGGQYAALYDQAGLMVRVDAENWVKCGTEGTLDLRGKSAPLRRDMPR